MYTTHNESEINDDNYLELIAELDKLTSDCPDCKFPIACQKHGEWYNSVITTYNERKEK